VSLLPQFEFPHTTPQRSSNCIGTLPDDGDTGGEDRGEAAVVSRFIVSIPAFRKPSSMCSWSSGRNQVGQAYHVNEGEPGGMAGLCDFRWTKPPAPVTVSASICEGTR